MILVLLKLDQVEFVKKIVLSVGLSISFLLIFGLILNNILLSLGYPTPLSTISLLFSFDLAYLFLIFILYNRFQYMTFTVPSLRINAYDKAILSMAILFPALMVFGTFIMNSKDNNSLLLLTLVLIPIYISSVCFTKSNLSKIIYPISVYSISISLLLIFMLRFHHINGHDVHLEYYTFQKTLDGLRWGLYLNNPLDSALSISMLPTIFQSILNVNSQEFLFKSLYVFTCSFSPLIIYIITNKYMDELYAFLASFFFMSQLLFLETAGSPRTSIAIFFVALVIMVLLEDNIQLVKKRLLFLIFIISVIFSHYSTTYITLILFTSSFILLELLKKSKKITFEQKLNSSTLLLFFILMFFWYSLITDSAFYSGIKFILNTLSQFHNLFLEESRSSEYLQLVGKDLAHPIVSQIRLAITLSSFLFIAAGVFTMCYRYRNMISFTNIRDVNPSYLKKKLEPQYLAMAIICSGLLVFMVVMPYVSVGYGNQRLFSLMLVVLSICFIIGGIELAKCLRVKPLMLILIILLPYFLFNCGVVNEIIYADGPITLNSNSSSYDLENVYESESVSAKWLMSHIQNQSQVYTSDSYTRLRLVSQGLFSQADINNDCFYFHEKLHEGYIYLGYNNLINEELIIDRIYDINEYSTVYSDMNKIYTNKESEIYYT
jgi:uncharacterized membrane protein